MTHSPNRPNRHERRAAAGKFNKDRKAAVRAVRAISNRKERVEYALSFARRLEACWPYFNAPQFLRACGLVKGDAEMWVVPGHPESSSSEQETPA